MSTITRLEFKNGQKKKINISKTGQNMKCSIEKTGQILLSWSIWNKYEKKRGKSHENDNPVLHRKRRKIPDAPPHQKAARHQQRQVDWCRRTCRRHGRTGGLPVT